MSNLSTHQKSLIRKRNRLSKQERKNRKHKISHESGRSTKDLMRRIIEKSQKLKRKDVGNIK